MSNIRLGLFAGWDHVDIQQYLEDHLDVTGELLLHSCNSRDILHRRAAALVAQSGARPAPFACDPADKHLQRLAVFVVKTKGFDALKTPEQTLGDTRIIPFQFGMEHKINMRRPLPPSSKLVQIPAN